MKPIVLQFTGSIALSLGLSGCIPAVDAPSSSPTSSTTAQTAATTPAAQPAAQVPPRPAPTPSPTVAPVTMPPPIMEQLPENWMDQPRAPGDWTYERESSETFALYGQGREDMLAIIRCDLRTRQVGIGMFGMRSASARMQIHTETMSRTLEATQRESAMPLVAAEVDANNRLLDAMAITKGNFAMQVDGARILYLPGWAEVTRVIEDCR
ncbi:hypothetical protein [Altererythrobacter lutimaris]|uniref:Uncharacterized protein n=1 Tax=Altererythrobacter lutimaris TaxID=2743979 RepID=A0A850H8L1_9SPHN|nr:hypothetical protein [Altererythrobacter lutimaris]NVE94203.1 hypothetical protein [Altererythrobacter lutimaris]